MTLKRPSEYGFDGFSNKSAKRSDSANASSTLPASARVPDAAHTTDRDLGVAGSTTESATPWSYATFRTQSQQLPRPYHTQDVAKLFEKHPAKILTETVHTHSDPSNEPFKGPSGPKLPQLPQLSSGPMAHAAFTHASVTDSKIAFTERTTSVLDYERLEFLGDAYLEVFATRLIFARFQHLPVGKQNRLREELVRNRTLAEFSRRYNFRSQIRIEPTLVENAARGTWEKILADVFEAYVAAVVLNDPAQGFITAEAWMIALWAPLIAEIETGRTDLDLEGQAKNFKEILNSHIGSTKGVTIDYRQIGQMWYTEDKSTQQYKMGCYVTGWGFEQTLIGVGVGQSKKEGGSYAAEHAIKKDPNVRIMKMRKEEYALEKRRKQQEEEDSRRRQAQSERGNFAVKAEQPDDRDADGLLKPSPLRAIANNGR